MMPKATTGVCADQAYSYKTLEKVATHVRTALKFSETSAIDPLWLFEGLDEISVADGSGRAIGLRGYVIELEQSEGFAKFDRDRGVIEVLASAQTYSWLEEEYSRAGYFVAHELGHCLLHTDQLMRLARMPVVQQAAFHRGGHGPGHEIFRDTEWQANAFASALLMPARGLVALEQRYKTLSPIDIAEHFRVSEEAATYRLDLYNKRKHQLL